MAIPKNRNRKCLNTSDLAEMVAKTQLAGDLNLSKEEIMAVYRVFVHFALKRIAAGDEVHLVKLGRYHFKELGARVLKRIKTGTEYVAPAKTRPQWKISDAVVVAVEQGVVAPFPKPEHLAPRKKRARKVSKELLPGFDEIGTYVPPDLPSSIAPAPQPITLDGQAPSPQPSPETAKPRAAPIFFGFNIPGIKKV